jgi:hypothetical protein
MRAATVVTRAGLGLGWLAAMVFLICGALFFLTWFTIGNTILGFFWTRTATPISFNLGPGLMAAERAYTLSETSSRYGRRDTLTIGAIADSAPSLILSVDYPDPAHGLRYDRDFVAFTRNWSNVRAVAMAQSGYRYRLTTRWGPVSASGFAANVDGGRKSCLAFLSQFATRSVAFAGYYCAPAERDPSVGDLACLLDRVTFKTLPKNPEIEAFIKERAGSTPTCSFEVTARPAVSRGYPRAYPVRTYRTQEERRRGW